MKSYKISVIVPVYNVKEYIRETMDSICNQSFKDFELILIDDGSTDGTYEILKEYKEENIILMQQENAGPSVARNKGLEIAKGDYIIFVDSDDLLPKDSLEVRYNTIKKYNSDIGIFGTYKYNGKSKWALNNHFLGNGEKSIAENHDLLLTLGPCNKIFKRDLLKNTRFPLRIKYAEDQVFIIETYLNAKKIYTSNYVSYYYRMRSENTESSLTEQIRNKSTFVLEQILKGLEITNKNIKNSNLKDSEKSNLKLDYFERLLKFDIWPALKNILLKGTDEEKVNGLLAFKKIIEKNERNRLSKSKLLEVTLTYEILHENKFLNPVEKEIYIDILNYVYGNSDNDSLKSKVIEMKNTNSIKPIQKIAFINGIKYNLRKSKIIIRKIKSTLKL